MTPDIKLSVVSYQEIKKGLDKLEGDKYGIAAYLLTESRRKTYLSNPYLTDDFKYGLTISYVDGVIGGRCSLYPVRFKKGDEVCEAVSGSSLEVHEDYRHLAIGADVFAYPVFAKEYGYIIFSGISDMALPLYKKLRFNLLAFPRMMLIGNARSILESKGLRGATLTTAAAVANLLLKPFNVLNRRRGRRIAERFVVEQLDVVPGWVDGIVLDDGHKYMEVHDHRWLQWNLDNNFRGLEQDKQSFYAIFKDEKPVGFFLIKERFRILAGGSLKNVLIGSIVEWGTKDEKILNESDINKIALGRFSKKCDIIEFATTDESTIKAMRSFGFIRRGTAHIGFKDLTKTCKDASDIKLWRVRYGYADVILT